MKTLISIVSLCSALSLIACSAPRATTPRDDIPAPAAYAELRDVNGDVVGGVSYTPWEGGVLVEARLFGLEVGPGFRGFHLHENGVCEPGAPGGPFMSAGGHWSRADQEHAEHVGDMPPLLVSTVGSASLSFFTDRFNVHQLLTAGVAQVVHSDRDNFGHIPVRYASRLTDEPGPDEDTLATGDAGDRVACGVVRPVGDR